MAVIVKNMEMPENCSECKMLCNECFTLWCCLTDREDVLLDDRPDWCPLVWVPKEANLIDANKLKRRLIPLWDKHDDQDFANKDVWVEIENAPVIFDGGEG